MRRRTYLAAFATGTSSIAGCSESEGSDPETEQPTDASPDISNVHASSTQEEYLSWEVVQISVEFENSGGPGDVDVRLDLESETVAERTVTVEGDKHEEAFSIENPGDGGFRYRVQVGDDTVSGDFIVITPVEQPMVVKEHEVLNKEDYSIEDAERVNFDVEVPANPHPPSRGEILDICRKIIYNEIQNKDWNAIGFNVWREDQRVGYEASHATITWGPNGSWSGAGSVETGHYSTHEFSVTGFPYLVVEGVEDVHTEKPDFRVEFTLVNRGVNTVTASGDVSTAFTDEWEFEIELEPGESESMWYESNYDGSLDSISYSIDVYNVGHLHGLSRAEIVFP